MQNLNLRDIYKKIPFIQLFCPHLPSKFEKSADMIQKNFFQKCSMGIKITKVAKKFMKKVNNEKVKN